MTIQSHKNTCLVTTAALLGVTCYWLVANREKMQRRHEDDGDKKLGSEIECTAANAFNIFTDVIVNEISTENYSLHEHNSRLLPLREYANSMEFRVNDTTIASCKFNTATVEECPTCACGQKVANWELHPKAINGTAPLRHVVKKRSSNVGGRIVIAGQAVGDFSVYSPLFSVTSFSPFVCLCHIMSEGSGYGIYGGLENLSEEDIELLCRIAKQHPPKEEFLLDDGAADLTAGVFFVPQFISKDVSLEISESLQLLQKEIDLLGGSSSPSEELRQLTMAALANKEYNMRLKDNGKIRSENNILVDIRQKFGEVILKHKEGSHTFKLDGGAIGTCKSKKLPQWTINIKKDEYHSICVDDIPSLYIVVSGVELSVKRYHYFDHEFAILFENRVRLFGTIKSNGESDVDLLSDSFQESLYDTLNDPTDESVFPHLSLWFDNLWFDYSTVQEALDLLKSSDKKLDDNPGCKVSIAA